jgi:hypothetical protein
VGEAWNSVLKVRQAIVTLQQHYAMSREGLVYDVLLLRQLPSAFVASKQVMRLVHVIVQPAEPCPTPSPCMQRPRRLCPVSHKHKRSICSCSSRELRIYFIIWHHVWYQPPTRGQRCAGREAQIRCGYLNAVVCVINAQIAFLSVPRFALAL